MEIIQTPSFDTVWTILQKVGENQKETDRILKELVESQKETARALKETDQVLKESSKDFNTRLGNYVNLFGEVTEYMLVPKLCEKFTEFGFTFSKTQRNISVRDSVNNIFLEIDVILENGDNVMLVEIKTKLTIERINNHINRLEKMRNYADLRGDKRIFLGAIAGVVVTEEIRDYALSEGFYLIVPSGDSFNITPPQGKPKEW